MSTLSHQANNRAVPGRAEMSTRVYISGKQAAAPGRAKLLTRIDIFAWPAWRGRSRSFEATNERTLYKISVWAVYILGKILTRVTLLDVDTLKYNLLRFAL